VDLVTHALLGAQVAHATAPRHGRMRPQERLWLGAAAAAFPDLDFVAFPFDPLAFLADWHQGPTHSLVLLPLWAALIAGAFARWTRRPHVFAEAATVAALAIGSHIAADVITAYGTAVFYPLSDRRVSLGTTFVIDPVFTGILIAGLLLGVRKASAWITQAGLLVLCMYVAGQWLLQQHAIGVGREAARERGLAIERLAVLPQPLSPLNWKLIGLDGGRYHVAHVNLIGHRSWVPPLPGLRRLAELGAAYQPPARLDWHTRHREADLPADRDLVRQRWLDPHFEPFRRFALYPAVSRIERIGAETCVWFTDLRYDLPGLPDTFRFGFCRVRDDRPWQLYRLRYFSDDHRQRLR
jgi:inner membrane protein